MNIYLLANLINCNNVFGPFALRRNSVFVQNDLYYARFSTYNSGGVLIRECLSLAFPDYASAVFLTIAHFFFQGLS